MNRQAECSSPRRAGRDKRGSASHARQSLYLPAAGERRPGNRSVDLQNRDKASSWLLFLLAAYAFCGPALTVGLLKLSATFRLLLSAYCSWSPPLRSGYCPVLYPGRLLSAFCI